jgi:hypothetical protein
MLSLLLLSAALATASPSVQATALSNDPLLNGSLGNGLIQPDLHNSGKNQSEQFDSMEFHPNADVCYKIRAYIFTKGPSPKFLRETTCGPKAPAARETDGFKPRLVPLDIQANPEAEPK